MRGTTFKAIVTGHSKGLGEALARELLERGISVLGLARDASPALAARFPALFSDLQIDLADHAALLRWLDQGGLIRYLAGGASEALLINNAGVVQPVGALHQQAPLEVARAVALNVGAPLMLAAAVAAASAACRIVHVSSGAGSKAYAGWSVYGATKAALDHHARAVAEDGGKDGAHRVRICSLAPGVIDTGMQAAIRATPAERFAQRERFVAMHRNGELVAPEHCAPRLIDYLLDARFGARPVDDLRSAQG